MGDATAIHGPATFPGQPRLTRRSLFGCLALGTGLLAARPVLAAIPATTGPVVGFHADAPWLDRSGRDLPYRPPAPSAPPVPDDESLARLGFFL